MARLVSVACRCCRCVCGISRIVLGQPLIVPEAVKGCLFAEVSIRLRHAITSHELLTTERWSG